MASRLKLDFLIATHERPQLLRHALDSLLAAPVPHTLDVRITVVQNDANTATSRLLADYQRRRPDRHGRAPDR